MKSAKKIVARTTNLRYVVEIAAELGVHKTTVHAWVRGTKPSNMASQLLKVKFPEFYKEITDAQSKKEPKGTSIR